jgi:hypothetical protein
MKIAKNENMLIINHNDRKFYSSIGFHILLHSVLIQHVAPQAAWSTKALATHDARKRSFFGMNSYVVS